MIFYPYICLDFFSVLGYNEAKEKNRTSHNHATRFIDSICFRQRGKSQRGPNCCINENQEHMGIVPLLYFCVKSRPNETQGKTHKSCVCMTELQKETDPPHLPCSSRILSYPKCNSVAGREANDLGCLRNIELGWSASGGGGERFCA